MKRLHLQSSNYKYLEQSFKEWLDILGYAESTVKGSPLHIREMFHYQEQKNIIHITQLRARHISDFLKYLQIRGNLKYGGGLSASSINSYINSLNLFARYVNQTGKHILDISPKYLERNTDERTILTKEEIKTLYESTYEPHPTFNSVAMGQRDRAIIAVFYGCGLRKEEGSMLNITDIDLIKKLVFVRKGKGNKQRYVPIANKHLEDIKAYLEEGRNWFLENHYQSAFYNRTGRKAPKKQNTDDEAFLLNMEGKRMKSFDARFRYMREKSGIEKHFSTHSLRHSIATHLLQSGMPIEEIAKFLGHATLESTQIYTHIANQFNHIINNEEYELAEF